MNPETTKALADARKLIDRCADLDPTTPADMTYRELCRVAKALAPALDLLEQLADAVEGYDAELSEVREENANLDEANRELEAQLRATPAEGAAPAA